MNIEHHWSSGWSRIDFIHEIDQLRLEVGRLREQTEAACMCGTTSSGRCPVCLTLAR
jgi:hypothetical protein